MYFSSWGLCAAVFVCTVFAGYRLLDVLKQSCSCVGSNVMAFSASKAKLLSQCFLSPRCYRLLQGLWLTALSGPRLAAARVPSRSLRKLGLPSPLLAAPQWFFLVTWRPRVPTFSVRHSRFFEIKQLGGKCCPQSEESHLLLAQLGSAQLPRMEPVSRNPYWSPQVWSSPYALNTRAV